MSTIAHPMQARALATQSIAGRGLTDAPTNVCGQPYSLQTRSHVSKPGDPAPASSWGTCVCSRAYRGSS